MIYAAILVCWGQHCVSLTDDFGPYRTHAECAARLQVMKATAVIALGHIPGMMLSPMCGSLDQVRRLIPDAYAGGADA
jgi:hypothetical protein